VVIQRRTAALWGKLVVGKISLQRARTSKGVKGMRIAGSYQYPTMEFVIYVKRAAEVLRGEATGVSAPGRLSGAGRD
jgi:hypothetical protein